LVTEEHVQAAISAQRRRAGVSRARILEHVRHLMLRADVVAAVEAGKFHIHAVDTVDDALALRMQKPAGSRDAGGRSRAAE